MARELERAGIPTALVTAMVSVAQSVGTPRIVTAQAIIHPTGNPGLGPEAETLLRRRLVELALTAVSTAVDGPRVFELVNTAVMDNKVTSRWLH